MSTPGTNTPITSDADADAAPSPGLPPGPPAPDPAREPDAARPRRWHYRRSLASRVTLLTTIAVGLAVTFMALGAYFTARAQLQSQLDQSLLNRAQATAKAGVLNALAQRVVVNSEALGASDVRIAFLNSDGSGPILDQGPDIAVGKPELRVARGEREQSIRTVESGDEKYRVVAVETPFDGQALVMAQSLDDQDRVLSRLGLVVLIFGMIGVLAAGVAGWIVARSGLRPVRRLTTSVEDIARTEDLTPMPVEGDDEIARLAGAFNQMLTSLDASRTRQRRLVTDAGHELRTPLTSLRTNVDLLTQSDDSGLDLPPEARTEMLGDIRAQIDELTTLIGDLTELARDEPLAPVVGTVDLSEIVDVSVARVRRRAARASLDVETEPWEVVGEAPGLERAVTNLLDNAVKWSPPGGTVHVRLHEGVLVVDDEGPGIAEADRERVFDRFWRAGESRTMPGSGLGLSIVKQVAERHSGAVRADASPSGGARLVMSLPGARP